MSVKKKNAANINNGGQNHEELTTLSINFEQLKKRCNMSIEDYANEPGFEKMATPDGVYYFKGSGSPILAVAHLDTVCGQKSFSVTDHKGEQRVYSPRLDDRLGAYIILDLLPSLGIKYDILLTEGEEVGNSTAQHFNFDGEPYNWMFSFDRAGDDVVTYDYESNDWLDVLEASGARLGIGMFSDICFLTHLQISGVNFGCGYHSYHSPKAYAIVSQTLAQVELFQRFYAANVATAFPHHWTVKEKPKTRRGHNLLEDIDWAKVFDPKRDNAGWNIEPDWWMNYDAERCDFCQTATEEIGSVESGCYLVCRRCWNMECAAQDYEKLFDEALDRDSRDSDERLADEIAFERGLDLIAKVKGN